MAARATGIARHIVVSENLRHFVDNATGAAWVPIGLNIAWPSGDPESYYKNLFATNPAPP